MARIETWFNQDLKKAVKVQYIDGNVFSADNNGNVVGINVFDEGSPASLSGSVSASIIRADGATVAAVGTLSGNQVSVALPQSAYAVPGLISIVIKLTSGSDITTLGAIVSNVYQSTTDTVVDPGTIIPSVENLIAEIEAAIASIPADYSSLWASLAPAFSTSETYQIGQYVTYDGGLYRCKIAHTGTWAANHFTSVTVGESIFNTYYALSASVLVDINEGDDVNTYVTPGNFAVKTVEIARTVLNLPVSQSGRLTVENNYSSSTIYQKFIPNSRDNIYFRKINKSTDPYTIDEWRSLVFKDVFDPVANDLPYRYALSSADLTAIPADSDANDYVTPGNYMINTTAIAQTVLNLPMNRTGRLTVENGYTATQIMQTYVDSTRENIFVRKINTNTDPYTVGVWHRIPFEDELSSDRTLKVLCIGNSGTNDCTAYTPYIIENISDVRFTLGTSYKGGVGIDDYITLFDTDAAELTYYKKTPGNEAWTSASSRTLKQIINSEDWDIILFQQKSTARATLSSYANLNTLINKVTAYLYEVKGKTARVGWLSSALNLAAAETVTYSGILACEQSIFETTPMEFIIPCMTAVQNARTTSLNNLGDSGGMTHDGSHLQCGLPSLVPSYLAAMSLLDVSSAPRRGILDEHTRPTQEWVTEHRTPGENGTSVGVTEDNCLLAQKCAIAALKFPDRITDCSNYEE